MILVAEYASGVGDVQLVEAVQALVTQKGYQQAEVPHLLRAMRWIALWRSGTGKQQALTEVKAADVANSDSLAVNVAAPGYCMWVKTKWQPMRRLRRPAP